MNYKEMYEYVIKNIKLKPKETFEMITLWAIKNGDNIGFSKEEFYLYKNAIKYLFNFKLGHLSYDETCLIVKFLAQEQSFFQSKLGYQKDVKVNILSKEEYKDKYGNSRAVCVNNESQFDVVYSPVVIENLMSDNIYKILRGVRTIYHEFLHTVQNQIITQNIEKTNTMTYSPKVYIGVLETISRNFEKEFYDKNYLNLLKENQAETFGLDHALSIIKEINPKLYELFNQDYVNNERKRLKDSMNNPRLVIQGKSMKSTNGLNGIADIMISRDLSLLNKYPILKLIYNDKGTRKTLTEIIKERQLLIESGYDSKTIDDLIDTAVNRKSYSVDLIKSEVQELIDCINNDVGDYDFIYSMLEYRLNVCKMSPEDRNIITSSFNRKNDNNDNKKK